MKNKNTNININMLFSDNPIFHKHMLHIITKKEILTLIQKSYVV